MGDRKQQQQLLGYLLGALDDAERERIDRRLARDPGLAAELVRVEESLEPLRTVARVHQPPPGLAARTCRRVFAYSQALVGRKGEPTAARRPTRERARVMSPAAVPPSSTAAWGWSDLLVAASVFLAIAGLLFPAIQSSRMNMRLVACQNNLRQLGVTQAQFDETHPGAFPQAAADPWMTVGVPGRRIANPSYESLLSDGGSAESVVSVVPAWRTERSDARRNEVPSTAGLTPFGPPYAGAARTTRSPLPFAGPGRAVPPHQGFRQAVGGQNVIFLDGHVVFVALGPIVDSTTDLSSSDTPFAEPWSSAGLVPGSSYLAPTVLVSRPRR